MGALKLRVLVESPSPVICKDALHDTLSMVKDGCETSVIDLAVSSIPNAGYSSATKEWDRLGEQTALSYYSWASYAPKT